MDTFSFQSLAQEIVCGIDTIPGAGALLERWAARRALVVCGPSIRRESDVVDRVQAALGTRAVALFDGVLPHAPVHTLDAAIAVARDARPDVIVSVGGGSTHDTSKGIAILLAEGGRIHEFETERALRAPRVPILAVSSTMGGAEISRGAGFTDKALGRKIGVHGAHLAPRGTIVDGMALATTPTAILVGTAVGQLRIAIEMVCSRAKNPFSDALALRAIALLTERLPRVAAKAPGELVDVKTAALMASMSNQGSLGLCTALAHQVGGLHDVGHGEANAILLPHVMRFNAATCNAEFAAIGAAMRVGDPAEAVAKLVASLGLPTRLREVGVPESALTTLAEATRDERSLRTNPRPIEGMDPILEVLHAAW